MKRTIGLLMMVGLMVGVVGCGDDDNPVKSNQDLVVGTWTIGDSDDLSVTLRSDGTYVEVEDGEESTGIWSLVGDQLTVSDSDGSDSETLTLNSVTDTEMTLTYKDEDGEETVTYTRKT
jgi:uncharacterized protein (TIGR03066 family)